MRRNKKGSVMQGRRRWSPEERKRQGPPPVGPDGGILLSDTGTTQEWLVPRRTRTPEEEAELRADCAHLATEAKRIWAKVLDPSEQLNQPRD